MLNEQNMIWLFISLATLAVVVLIIVLLRYLKRSQHTRQINKLISDLAKDNLRDVLVPDSIDGEIWIDHLLLTDGGLLILDIRDYTGKVFGGEAINEWTQMIGVKSHRFNNPLLELPARVHAIKALVGDVAVTGQVVFTHRGSFPKGQPDAVCMVDEVYERMSGFLRPALPEDKLNDAWSKVKQAIRS